MATEKKYTATDIKKNKGMALVAYFLFFIPLLTEAKDSPFAKFHVKQSLLILVFGMLVGVAGSIIPILGWFIILPFGSLAILILWFMGLLNALKGVAEPVPFIGKYAEEWFNF